MNQLQSSHLSSTYYYSISNILNVLILFHVKGLEEDIWNVIALFYSKHGIKLLLSRTVINFKLIKNFTNAPKTAEQQIFPVQQGLCERNVIVRQATIASQSEAK